MSYGLKTNYSQATPVSPGDLNRRADVIQAQLPGAFDALGVGILGAGDLLVDNVNDEIAAGRALVLGSDDILVYVLVPAAVPIPLRSDETYLHLALRVPDAIGGPGDTSGTDSKRGAPPVPLLSDTDDEPDALLLAEWDGSTWVDRRPKSRLVALEADVAQLKADVGYDASARAIGTVAARLLLLAGSGEGGEGGGGGTLVTLLSQLGFNEAIPTDAIVQIRAEIAAAIATIAPGSRATRQPIDLIVHELQIQRGELATAQETIRVLSNMLLSTEQKNLLASSGLTVRPRVIERSESLTIGPGFGSGENSTPDFEGAGPAKNDNGTFGVAS